MSRCRWLRLSGDRGAPRELVFDVVAAPYLARQPRAVAEKIRVLERATDMVLAAHRTPVRGRLVATTVETVRFSRPDRVDFRLVRGPVPYVVEQFVLTTTTAGDGTRLEYSGEPVVARLVARQVAVRDLRAR